MIVKDLLEIINHAKSRIETLEIARTTMLKLREAEQNELKVQRAAVEYCTKLMHYAHREEL